MSDFLRAGDRVRVRGHSSARGKGLTYLGFTGVLLEDVAPGGWDVVDVRARNGVQSVYAFSLEPAPNRVRRNPNRNVSVPLTGYIDSMRLGAPLVSAVGKVLPWILSEVVAEYRNREHDKSAAVILTHARRRGMHAAGYLLVDGGSLFRGEQWSSVPDFHDLRMAAKTEAEYFAQLDANDADDADE